MSITIEHGFFNTFSKKLGPHTSVSNEKSPHTHTHKHWFGYSFRDQCGTVQVPFTDKKKKDIRNRYKNILQNIERDPTPVPQKVLGKAQHRETLGKIHKKRWNL